MKYLEEYSDVEKAAKHIFRQVAEGIQYLHNEMKIAHRDLKPENIMYVSDGDKVKIGDFTVAMEITDDDMEIKNQEGTKAFEAPECTSQESFKPRPLDIWAYGVTLYSYVTGKLPFYGETDQETT